ncbi:hypothetical protein KCU85_g4790, partial [Aureobasidium melanogenum]
MWIHVDCYCRLCAGRNVPSDSPVSPLSPSFHHRIGFDTPPSPLSPALSFTSTSLPLPSPISPLLIAAEDWSLSPVSPFALEPFSPSSESTAPASPALSIAELTPRDFPSPASPLTTDFVWDLCIIPSIPAKFSVFAPIWHNDTSFPFNAPATEIDDEAISPTTLPDGTKAIQSSAALPPRPITRRPKRSPLLTSKFSWGSTPTTSPSVTSPDSFRFTGPIYTFETVAEEVKSRAGSLSFASSDSASIHTLGTEGMPLKFENKPWWENIPEVSPLPSPTLSVHSFGGFSGVHGSPNGSEFDLVALSHDDTDESDESDEIDISNIYWTEVTPQTATEYTAIFGTSVFEDEFAWIRYPIPGPHDLCPSPSFSSNDETAGYDWDKHNPTAFDSTDPFSEVDDVFESYADSVSSSYLSSFASSSSSSAGWSFEVDGYSGVEESVGVAETAEVARARYISSFLSRSAVAGVKEICTEDRQIASLDLIVASVFSSW